MPVQLSYPGVYVEEVPSGVRTITGVATSITAFVGRVRRGTVGAPIRVNSFADFERDFGGLWAEAPLSFSVRDFYINGGSAGLVVRLYKPYFASDSERADALDAAEDVAGAANGAADNIAAVVSAAEAEKNKAGNAADPRKSAAETVFEAVQQAAAASGATASSVKAAADDAVGVAAPITRARFTVNTGGDALNLEAANEGAWGNMLRVRIDHDVKGPDAANLFNLSVKDTATGQLEIIRNVSVVNNHTRRVDNVLVAESRLLRVRGTLTGDKPNAHSAPAAGTDPFSPSSSASQGVDSTGLASDGSELTIDEYKGSEAGKTGIYALAKADLFNLLVIPPFTPAKDVVASLWATAATYCEKRRAMLLVDAPRTWTKASAITSLDSLNVAHKNAALFFPRLRQPNPLKDNQVESFAPSGSIAGVFARTDTERGVWKAPAGLDATLRNAPDLSVLLNDAENGELNTLGINCLRSMAPAGRIIWGARTLRGDDRFADEWKYIPVRRTALFIEESLYRGTHWVVFEPNDEPLWAQIRLNVGSFMQGLFRQGAFQGATPREAYFVKCDAETTTQQDINSGVVNIVVGFAPLKPAEFVVIKLQQMAGQLAA